MFRGSPTENRRVFAYIFGNVSAPPIGVGPASDRFTERTVAIVTVLSSSVYPEIGQASAEAEL